MLTVKIMSGQDISDSNPSKGFALFTLASTSRIYFERNDSNNPELRVDREDGVQEMYYPQGNVYVMENGKTIASFAHMPPND